MCLYPLTPVLSFACSAGSVLILLCNLILNRELIDRAFPEKESSNVIAKFEPRGPSDRLVILSCHHDSNFAFPIVNRFGSGFSVFMAIVVLSGALLTVLTFLRVLSDDPVLGANDNLSGVANCLLLAEHLACPQTLGLTRPGHMNIYIVQTRGWMLGVRAVAFYDQGHLPELRRLEIRYEHDPG